MTPKTPHEDTDLLGADLVGTGDETGLSLVPVRAAEAAVRSEHDPLLRPSRLRRALLAVDVMAATAGWGLGFALPLGSMRPLPHSGSWAALTGLGIVATLAAMAGQRLYRARSCAVWSTEIRRVARAVGTAVAALVVVALLLDARQALLPLGVTAVTATLALVLGRAAYRTWLAERRRRGQYTRALVLAGANEHAVELHQLLEEQAELGFRIRGVVCQPRQAHWATHLGVPWLGPVEAAEDAVRLVQATGVVAVATAISDDQLNRLVRVLPRAGVHLHVAHGVHGVAPHRLHTVPFGSEPLLYVESLALGRRRMQAKRAMDLVLGAVGLALTTPVLLGAMLGIKLEDGGPVLFRQPRVGLDGKIFPIVKLRTMRVDAEQQRLGLAASNTRDGGPLFKMADDPRVTRVGRLLRATSLDELPQLWNVLRGQMSLVGPRPALLEEHAAFDPQLQRRDQVLPGMTGLWQVEARDNPAFGPYRRLDLHYVENWSIGLDMAILLATAVAVVARALSALRRLPRPRTVADPPVLD